MWMRIFLASLIALIFSGCMRDDPARGLNTLSISIRNDTISIYYTIDEHDQVRETVSLSTDVLVEFPDINKATIAQRQYVVKGAYGRLINSSNWAISVRSAPSKIKQQPTGNYFGISSVPSLLPKLSLEVVERPLSTGNTYNARIPIPTRRHPRNGLTPNWASERAWMGQMVGQFLDVVGPPKLNPEDYVNRVPEARRNQMPLKLNFSDYR